MGPVPLGNPFPQREAQSGAARIRKISLCAPIEAIEDSGDIVGWDSDPRVKNGKNNTPAG